MEREPLLINDEPAEEMGSGSERGHSSDADADVDAELTRLGRCILWQLAFIAVIHVLLLIGLAVLYADFTSHSGLMTVFDELNTEFATARNTLEGLNNSFNELYRLMDYAVINVVPNVYEMCYQVSLHDNPNMEPRGKCMPLTLNRSAWGAP